MDKYLITGCSGFVGQHFLNFLEVNKIKCQVLGLDLDPQIDPKTYKNVRLNIKKVDLLDLAETERIIFDYQPNYILHLASFSSVAFSWKNPTLSFKNNVNIFLNLLEVVRKYSLKTRILSIGSSEEYGNVKPEDTPLKESFPLQPLSPYAVARVSQEMLSKLYADSFGIDIIMTRSFNHIGPGQRDVFVVPSFIRRILEAKINGEERTEIITGNLEITRDFLDVRDVVSAYYLLLKKGKKGEIYNICSGSPIKLSEIIDKISQEINIKVETKISPELVRPNDNLYILGDNTKIKSDTGWKISYPIDLSLKDTIEYWKNNLSKE